MSPEKDILGKALMEYFRLKKNEKLIVHSSYEVEETYDPAYFFRRPVDFPDLEQYALELCSGNILEVGAGTGSHSLFLQEARGMRVTGLDISGGCVNIMVRRGLSRVIHGDVFQNPVGGFDTILMLMNGIGIAGTLKGFRDLLDRLRQITTQRAVILFDSSDISYAFSKEQVQGDPYFGEVRYQFEYNRELGHWFNWLYLDQETLFEACQGTWWYPQVMFEDDSGHYLARLYRKD